MARLDQVRLHVKPESQNSNRRLCEHHDKASIKETACDDGDEWNDEKSNGKCRRNDWNPFCSHEEAIRRMIGERQHKVSKEATDREEKYPARPFGAARSDHAVHEQQESESCIGQRRCKRRGVRKALEGSVKEEPALQMVENTAKADQYREPSN